MALYLVLRSRSTWVTTETELKLIASAANMGESSKPVNGNNTPAVYEGQQRIKFRPLRYRDIPTV